MIEHNTLNQDYLFIKEMNIGDSINIDKPIYLDVPYIKVNDKQEVVMKN